MSFIFVKTNCVVINSKMIPITPFFHCVWLFIWKKNNQMFLGKEQAMELTSHRHIHTGLLYNIILSDLYDIHI